MAARPAPDCRLFVVDDQGVVFAERLQALYALNTTATFLWIGLEEGRDARALASDLAGTFGLDALEARAQVEACLDSWAGLGLLEDGQRPPLTRPPPYDPGPLPAPPATLPEPFAVRRYRLLDTGLTVAYGSAAEEARVHPVLGHLESDAPAPHESRLAIVALADGLLLVRDGEAAELSGGLEGLAPLVKTLFLSTALNNHRHLLNIHAGALARGERLLLLPAATGHGKSSLTSALVRAGWGYVTDENAPLGVDDLRIRPVPIAIGLKRGAWELLAPLYPEIAGLAVHDREDGKRVRYLPPPATSIVPDRPEGYAARWIVFPHYRPGAATRLEPLSRVDMLARLFAECMSLSGDLDHAVVERLIAWSGTVSGFTLENGSLDEAVECLEALPA